MKRNTVYVLISIAALWVGGAYAYVPSHQDIRLLETSQKKVKMLYDEALLGSGIDEKLLQWAASLSGNDERWYFITSRLALYIQKLLWIYTPTLRGDEENDLLSGAVVDTGSTETEIETETWSTAVQLWFPDLIVQRVFHSTRTKMSENGQYPINAIICNKGEPFKNMPIGIKYTRASKDGERRIKTVKTTLSMRTDVCTKADDQYFRISPKDMTYDSQLDFFTDAGYASTPMYYGLFAAVDPLNKVFETSEENNIRSGSVRIYPRIE